MKLQNVTSSNLVAIDINQDIMPVVFACCDYSLTLGEPINVEYNFDRLEKQLEEKFIVGRQRIRTEVDSSR